MSTKKTAADSKPANHQADTYEHWRAIELKLMNAALAKAVCKQADKKTCTLNKDQKDTDV